mmetsp:Transcript_4807/g.20596  ORF Transcript_4807/g.20596 Transcript_4807/m.20596 type:complete len:206 (+) Transcript_4807:1956-2573(+)
MRLFLVHRASRPSTSERFSVDPSIARRRPSERKLTLVEEPPPPWMLQTSLSCVSVRRTGGSASGASSQVMVVSSSRPRRESTTLADRPEPRRGGARGAGPAAGGFTRAVARSPRSAFWNSSLSCWRGMPLGATSANTGWAARTAARKPAGKTSSCSVLCAISSKRWPSALATPAAAPGGRSPAAASRAAWHSSGTARMHCRVAFM